MSIFGADEMNVDAQEEVVKVLTAQFLRENPEIQLSPMPDIITLEADEADPRAKMPGCGHAITPSSLTQYMRSLVTEKRENIIKCCAQRDASRETAAQARQNQGCGVDDDPICRTIWPYPVCRKIALLTQDEKEFFETKLSSNFVTNTLNMKPCPRCGTHYYRDQRDPATAQNVRTTCLVCKGEQKDFCFRCGLTWKAMNNQLVCGNDTCVASLTKVAEILSTCPEKIVAGMKVPSVRACPYPSCLAKFPQLVEHVEHCKYMTCPSCKGKYCHGCLTTFTDKNYPMGCGGQNRIDSICTNIAKRQTLDDVKKGHQA